MVGDGEELAVDYESLRYIELRGDGSKLPAHKWGGYNQDFDDAEHIHTHEEVEAHPSEEWGVVDCEDFEHGSLSLLIFDIDIHKAPEDFDHGRIDVPEGTLLVKSQSGGYHGWFAVHVPRGELNEGDFHVTEDLPFDIDIRGSAVSHHVVAPADIPGVDGQYEIVNNEPIKSVFEPTAACDGITLDGEPAIEYNERKRVDIDFDRPAEPPEDMPECYHAGLSLRAAAPDDHPNTHKVNVLTALCGLAAGYDAEDVASHMCGEYSPHDGDADLTDKEETQYQIEHIAGMLESGQYSPPALSTLRDYGILEEDESCGDSCPIALHSISTIDTGGARPNWGRGERDWEGIEDARLNLDWGVGRDEVVCRRARAVESWQWSYDEDGEPEEIIGLNVIEPIGSGETVTPTLWLNEAYHDHKWEASQTVETKVPGRVAGRIVNAEPLHKIAHRTGALYRDCLNAQARAAIAHRLTQAMHIVTVGAADDKTLYVYDPEKGIWDDDGREVIRSVFEGIAPGRASDTEKREIVSKVADRTRAPSSEVWDPRGEFDDEGDYRVVGNGILKLPKMQADGTITDVELLDHSPELRARSHLPVDYNPDADTTTVEEWLEDITAREADARTLEEIVGNVLTTDYRHPYIVMLHGPGRNSKGTFLDVVAELAGGAESQNVCGNRLGDLATNKFRTGMLDRAIVNINGDIEGKKIQHGSKLKELTGEEVQEGESKFDDSETFRNTAKLLFAANSPPLPPETKTSWEERWLPLELPYQYVSNPDQSDPAQKKADNTIKTRLKQDKNLEAMLVLAVEGLKRLEETQDVSLPESPAERLEAYQKDADPIGEVDAVLLEEAPDSGAKLPKEAAYAAYKSLARANGDDPVEANRFWRLFKPRATIPINESRPTYEGDRVRVLKGVRFTEAAREHLSNHWLQHDWVNIDPAKNEDHDTVKAAETGNPLPDVSLKGIPDQSGYVNVTVTVAAKTTLQNGVVEITVQDDTGARDIIVKDRGNDEMDVADSVNVSDFVRFEWVKPGADLKVRAKTTATVIDAGPLSDGDDDAGDSANGTSTDTGGDGDGTPPAEAGETPQDVVRADGGDSEGNEPDGHVDAVSRKMDRLDELKTVIEAQSLRDDNAGARLSHVIDEMTRRVDVDRETVENDVQALLKKGEVYEPATGRLRTT